MNDQETTPLPRGFASPGHYRIEAPALPEPTSQERQKLLDTLDKHLQKDAYETAEKGVYEHEDRLFAVVVKWNERLQRPSGHRVFLSAEAARNCEHPSDPTLAEVLTYGAPSDDWSELGRASWLYL
jgi:hypothetical protein